MSPVETVVYSDGATATGVAPLPRRSPAQQGHDHLCSLRRQMRFLERVKPGHADSRREIAALRWAIETLELARAASAPQPADAELRRLHQFAEDQIGRATAAEAALQMTKATHALKIAAVEAQRDALLEALQALYDEQNGPPLIRHQAAWEAAMEKARAAIKAVEEIGRSKE